MKKVLVVDDEIDIRELLTYNLKKEGYNVESAENGIKGIEKAKSFCPDIIILDVMMPEMDGITTCEELRSNHQFQNTIICFLTARNEDYSQIAGLEAGADDYVNKPIKPKVLLSKIKSLLRRKEKKSNDTKSDHKDFFIDRNKYLVYINQKEIILPKKQFELLSLLYSEINKVFTREEILEKIWGSDIVVGDRTIDVHIRKLREKIGVKKIITIKGVGYKFVLQ